MPAKSRIEQLDEVMRLRAAGDFERALKGLTRLDSISVHPRDKSSLRLYQASCLVDMGQIDEARRVLSTVIKTDLIEPLQADCEYEWARIERAGGNISTAYRHIESAQLICESFGSDGGADFVSGNVRTLRGILMAESGRCEDAMAILRAVPVQDRGWSDARMRLGDCLFARELYREAIECYMDIVSSDQGVRSHFKDDAQRNIGCALYWLGDYAGAVEYLERVKNAYQEYPNLSEQLADFLLDASSRIRAARARRGAGGWPRSEN